MTRKAQGTITYAIKCVDEYTPCKTQKTNFGDALPRGYEV